MTTDPIQPEPPISDTVQEAREAACVLADVAAALREVKP